MSLEALQARLQQSSTLRSIGRVVQARGTVIKVSGLRVRVGELCRLKNPHESWSLQAEVVGLEADGAVLVPLGNLRNLAQDAEVEIESKSTTVSVSDKILGRILNANGHPLDDLGDVRAVTQQDIYGTPPDAIHRRPVDTVHATGIRAIDGLLTVGQGQRVGIFAPAGCGKSTLLGMLTQSDQTDVNVVALIGERGREVNDFVAHQLSHQKNKTVVVAATSDQPPLYKVRALNTATAIAEYFRDQGQRVQLLVDSITRYARALRDIGLAAGEPPTRQGFPPSVFATLPEILERSGNSDKGSMTAFYTVLSDDSEQVDPIAEEVRSILDGHIVLSRQLANRHHYPAIDILASASRLIGQLATPNHQALAGKVRTLLAKHQELELLIQMGEYQAGNDPEADLAVSKKARVDEFLKQNTQDHVSYPQTLSDLEALLEQDP